MADRREDPVALLGDRAGELHEARQSAAARPCQPAVKQPLGGWGGQLVDLA